MSARLSEVQQFIISPDVVRETVKSLRYVGGQQLECLVLWLGKVEGNRAFVIHAFTPPQESISSEDGVGYFVSGNTLFSLNQALAESGLRLLAQVHSHPTDAYHSETDDRYAIVTAEGGLSLVVPDFGAGSQNPLDWAVYRLTDGDWIELSHAQCGTVLKVFDARTVS